MMFMYKIRKWFDCTWIPLQTRHGQKSINIPMYLVNVYIYLEVGFIVDALTKDTYIIIF